MNIWIFTLTEGADQSHNTVIFLKQMVPYLGMVLLSGMPDWSNLKNQVNNIKIAHKLVEKYPKRLKNLLKSLWNESTTKAPFFVDLRSRIANDREGWNKAAKSWFYSSARKDCWSINKERERSDVFSITKLLSSHLSICKIFIGSEGIQGSR